jgi:ferric-dicitrate binding protein FerR (iron transport regulator)
VADLPPVSRDPAAPGGRDLAELALRYLDGEATAAEEAELTARIAADPASRAEFAALCRQVAALREVLAPAEASSRHAARTEYHLHARRLPVSIWSRRRAWIVPAAAALLVAGLIGFAWRRGPSRDRVGESASVKAPERKASPVTPPAIEPTPAAPDTALARIEARLGSVAVQRDGKPIGSLDGAALRSGDRLRVGPGGWLRARYADGSIVEADAATDLDIDQEDGAPRLALAAGRIFVNALPPSPGRAWVINADRPDRAEILGTAFEMGRLPEATVIRVLRGAVAFGRPAGSVTTRTQVKSLDPSGKAPPPTTLLDHTSTFSQGGPVTVRGNFQSRVQGKGNPSPPAPVEPAVIAPWRSGTPAGLRATPWNLDDPNSWEMVKELPAQIAGARATVDATWKQMGQSATYGWISRQIWDLREGPVAIQAKATLPPDRGKYFFHVAFHPTAHAGNTKQPERILRLEYFGSQGAVKTLEILENPEKDVSLRRWLLYGPKRDLDPGPHLFELVVSRTEMLTRMDRQLVHRGPHFGELRSGYLAFAVNVEWYPDGGSIAVEDVRLGRSDLLPP